jgi:hypothetical protein
LKLNARSTIADVAGTVGDALREAGISAVLTGGACAAIYSRGGYQSHDLDYIIRGDASRRALDQAMARIGFGREGDRYVHFTCPFFVEFPRGPLAIGDDFQIMPVTLRLRRGSTLALSTTDACRDRLAAFYHWDDRQSLEAALAIARKQTVNMNRIRRWSLREGFLSKFEEFRTLAARRRTGRSS